MKDSASCHFENDYPAKDTTAKLYDEMDFQRVGG